MLAYEEAPAGNLELNPLPARNRGANRNNFKTAFKQIRKRTDKTTVDVESHTDRKTLPTENENKTRPNYTTRIRVDFAWWRVVIERYSVPPMATYVDEASPRNARPEQIEMAH